MWDREGTEEANFKRILCQIYVLNALMDVNAWYDRIIIYYHLFYADIVESGALHSVPGLVTNSLTAEVWMPHLWNKVAALNNLKSTS